MPLWACEFFSFGKRHVCARRLPVTADNNNESRVHVRVIHHGNPEHLWALRSPRQRARWGCLRVVAVGFYPMENGWSLHQVGSKQDPDGEAFQTLNRGQR